jgi:MFS family permease
MLTKEAVLSCIASVCITASYAFISGFGMSVIYITSHFRSYDSAVSVNQVDFVMLSFFMVNAVSFVLSVWFVDQVGAKLTNLIGVLVMTLSFGFACFTTNVWLFVTVFGVLMGIGGGISCMTGTNVALRHFTANRGKALGVCGSGIGLGSILYGLLFTYTVNPLNSQPDVEVHEGAQTVYYFNSDISRRVPLAFMACGILCLLLGVSGSLLMRIKELPSVQLAANNEEEMLSHKGDDQELLTTVGQALRQPRFWKMFGAMYCGQSFCSWVMVSYKSFGSLYINDDHFLSYIGSTGAILNVVARVLFPFLLDYFSFYTVNMGALALQVLLACSIYSSVHSELAYMAVVMAVFFIQGSQFFPFSLLCLNEYGLVLGPKVFSYLASASLTAGAMPGIYYWLTVKHFGYLTSFLIQGLHSLVGLLLCYSLSQPAKTFASEVSSQQSFELAK